MMRIFNNETKDGIFNKISIDTLSIASNIFIEEDTAKAAKGVPLGSKSAVAYPVSSDDVTYVNSILVTANWNSNDDVFTSDELYEKATTPKFKPANMNHEGSQFTENRIFGVIVDTYTVDHEYCIAGKDCFRHILVSIMLWKKYFPDDVMAIKSAILKNKKYVSMECHFKDFGYALRTTKGGSVALIQRNEETSSMTKSLRVYGGTGKINVDGTEYQIGRWIRNYVFTGVGFVDNPGNPESIIFTDSDIVKASAMNFVKLGENTNLVDFLKSGVLFTRGNVPLWLN